ncbi:hypothetical protein LRU_01806 [Ligilactobacillus ruminis SPM0211]|uniref:Uncharacterized protein n=1 Tax=Ligilactobacillus ruminis SPM0211 TaxID=1040964 RepID=F7R299_9LACO|nr:hypothetical protein LRU_01806 [Ligilactobacillus ruminis SPM0211]
MLDLKERSKLKFIKHCTVFCQKNAKSRAQTQLLINQ